MIIEKLKTAIKKSGKTRYEIYKETGINQGVLSRIVNGGGCSIETAEILLEYFNLKIVDGKEDEK
jgi:DNA transposition AAA+ family ATPase